MLLYIRQDDKTYFPRHLRWLISKDKAKEDLKTTKQESRESGIPRGRTCGESRVVAMRVARAGEQQTQSRATYC